MQPRTIIIFGASGGTGRQIAKIAKAQGNEVVAVIRKPEQAKAFEDAGIRTVLFDISTEASAGYVKLLQDTKPNIAIWAAGASLRDLNPRAIEFEAQTRVYDAMRDAGVRRVVVVSSEGTWKEGSELPDWYDEEARAGITKFRSWIPKLMEAKYEAEAYLRQLRDIDWIIIRPGELTDQPAGGVKLGKVGVAQTSRETVGQAVVASVDYSGLIGRTIDILDGSGSTSGEIEKVIREDIDTWVGQG